MDPAMVQGRAAETGTDVSEGFREYRRGEDLGGGVEAHWKAKNICNYCCPDLTQGQVYFLHFENPLIEVHSNTDWSSLKVLWHRSDSIRGAITWSWRAPYRGYVSLPHPCFSSWTQEGPEEMDWRRQGFKVWVTTMGHIYGTNKLEKGTGVKKEEWREENIFKGPVVFVMARCNLRDKPIKLKRGRAN